MSTPHDAAKDDQRAGYSVGDYGWLARLLMPAAEELVAAVGVGPGDRVIDVAAGTGNVAVAAARRGAEVVAVDLTPAQVDAGRERTAQEGLPVEWMVGDAEALPVGDGSFDHVLSAFGVMYAPRREVAVAELLRVAGPAGTVGVVAWPPGGFNDQIGDAAEKLLGVEDDGGPGASDWGDPDAVERMFAQSGRTVRCERGTVAMEAESAQAIWEAAAANVGFVVMLRSALSDDDFAAFGRAYTELVERASVETATGIRADIPYLRTIVGR